MSIDILICDFNIISCSFVLGGVNVVDILLNINDKAMVFQSIDRSKKKGASIFLSQVKEVCIGVPPKLEQYITSSDDRKKGFYLNLENNATSAFRANSVLERDALVDIARLLLTASS